MSKAKFTSEQQLLRNNSYTIRVTENMLNLSKEFKELFYDVLGKQRIWWISHTIRKQFEKTGEFRDIRTLSSSVTAKSPEEKIRQLEHLVNHLIQEVEFLKRISSIRSTRK